MGKNLTLESCHNQRDSTIYHLPSTIYHHVSQRGTVTTAENPAPPGPCLKRMSRSCTSMPSGTSRVDQKGKRDQTRIPRTRSSERASATPGAVSFLGVDVGS